MKANFVSICSIAAWVIAVLVLACGSSPTSTNTGPYSDPDDYSTTDVEGNIMAIVISGGYAASYTSITDQNGCPIENLTPGNFAVCEALPEDPATWLPIDNSDITVETIGSSSENVSFAITMDYSGSMSPSSITDMEESISSFVNMMSAYDRGEIIKFASYVNVMQSFTSDKDALDSAVYAYFAGSGGNTALLDAIYQGLTDCQLETNILRVVLAFTDGQENASSHSLYDVLSLANTERIPIYTIGLGNVVTAYLELIADSTGGRYYYAPTSSELLQIYQMISTQMTESYILTWPTNFTATSKGTGMIRIIPTYECGNGVLTDTLYAEVEQ